MKFKSREHALDELKKWVFNHPHKKVCYLRCYKTDGEEFSPGEMALMDHLYQIKTNKFITPGDYTRYIEGMAKALGLNPLPKSFIVTKRIKGEETPTISEVEDSMTRKFVKIITDSLDHDFIKGIRK